MIRRRNNDWRRNLFHYARRQQPARFRLQTPEPKKKKLDAARSTPRGLAAHGRSRPHSRSHMPKSMCGCYVNTRPSMSQRLPYMSAKHGVDFPRSASRIRKTSKARSSPQRKFSNDLEKSVGVHYLHEAHVCTFGAAVWSGSRFSKPCQRLCLQRIKTNNPTNQNVEQRRGVPPVCGVMFLTTVAE